MPLSYFVNRGKPNIKFIWKGKEPVIVTRTLKRKNKVENSHYPISRLTINLQQSSQDGVGEGTGKLISGKSRQNRPEPYPQKYIQVIFFTKAQRQFNEERTVLSTNSSRTIGRLYTKKKKESRHRGLISYIKLNSKWDVDLTVKYETIKLLEENIA